MMLNRYYLLPALPKEFSVDLHLRDIFRAIVQRKYAATLGSTVSLVLMNSEFTKLLCASVALWLWLSAEDLRKACWPGFESKEFCKNVLIVTK